MKKSAFSHQQEAPEKNEFDGKDENEEEET